MSQTEKWRRLFVTKSLYVLLHKLILLFPAILKNKTWMRKWDDLFKEIMFLIYTRKKFKILLAADAKATIGFKTKSQLLFDFIDEKRHKGGLQ